ncbi:MAG TPA: DUF922 domain-containing protein [Chitinophagaceae bacterium]|jgi:hypothetical protein|nr:DUF922 domain-containing protein [Chitinophagaceae bacterium]
MMNPYPLLIILFSALHFSGTTLNKVLPATLPEVMLAPLIVHDSKEDDEMIPWAPDRPLTWEDFLCEPQRNTDAVASTSTSLGLAYQIKNGKLTYQITCNFSKTRSWGLMKTNYILAHEQGHFDITEIFARKLHKGLMEYTPNRNTFKKDIDDIYQSIIKQKEAFQNTYDHETDHSRKKAIQLEWLVKIKSLLKESQSYDNYP